MQGFFALQGDDVADPVCWCRNDAIAAEDFSLVEVDASVDVPNDELLEEFYALDCSCCSPNPLDTRFQLSGRGKSDSPPAGRCAHCVGVAIIHGAKAPLKGGKPEALS